MDPPLVNETSFSAVNPSVCSLAEIWQFGGEPKGGVLGLRIGNLGRNLRGFAEGSGNRDGSAVTKQSGRGGRRKRKDVSSEAEFSKMIFFWQNDSNGKLMKLEESRDENCGSKAEVEVETNSADGTKPPDEPSSQQPSEPPKDYIHVRARRGQATDSHSLGERARREKISERMKILQELVPGCNKVIGKAHVLDEIINYIQSLQRQVEFLSMKLEADNSRMNAIERNTIKDSGVQPFDGAGMVYGWQAIQREYGQGLQHEWLHMQIGGGFERAD